MGECPRCGRANVRLSGDPWRHALRAAWGTRKRRCLACGHRWLAEELSAGSRRALIVTAAAAAVAAAAFDAFGPALDAAFSGWSAGGSRSSTSRAGSTSSKAGADSLVASFWAALSEEEGSRGGRPRAAPGDGSSTGHAVEIVRASDGFDIAALIAKLIRSSDESQLQAVDRMSKRELWDRYGSYFSSKQQAQQAYDEYKKQRASPSQSR